MPENADQNPESVVTFKDQAYDVATQVPGLDEGSLEDARRLIGVNYRGAQATIEITKDNIRDYCNYMGSENPIFLAPEHAGKSRWGGIIAPPSMAGQAIIAPGLRGIQWIYAGIEWEFFRVMRPGDVITQTGKLVDAQEKKGRTVACNKEIIYRRDRLRLKSHNYSQKHKGRQNDGKRQPPNPACSQAGRTT